jgi:hypothetical protein
MDLVHLVFGLVSQIVGLGVVSAVGGVGLLMAQFGDVE